MGLQPKVCRVLISLLLEAFQLPRKVMDNKLKFWRTGIKFRFWSNSKMATYWILPWGHCHRLVMQKKGP